MTQRGCSRASSAPELCLSGLSLLAVSFLPCHLPFCVFAKPQAAAIGQPWGFRNTTRLSHTGGPANSHPFLAMGAALGPLNLC